MEKISPLQGAHEVGELAIFAGGGGVVAVVAGDLDEALLGGGGGKAAGGAKEALAGELEDGVILRG